MGQITKLGQFCAGCGQPFDGVHLDKELRPASAAKKFECDLCDGCGWYEGGPTIKTHCHKCDGRGYVYV